MIANMDPVNLKIGNGMNEFWCAGTDACDLGVPRISQGGPLKSPFQGMFPSGNLFEVRGRTC